MRPSAPKLGGHQYPAVHDLKIPILLEEQQRSWSRARLCRGAPEPSCPPPRSQAIRSCGWKVQAGSPGGRGLSWKAPLCPVPQAPPGGLLEAGLGQGTAP